MGMAHLGEADRESFWDSLSSQGLRVGIFDVPKCGLPRPINGIHLVDWLVHGRYFREPKSYPESLAREIVERFGPAPPSRCESQGPPLSDEEVREVIANLRTSIARKRAAGLHYLKSGTWDLFVIGFKEAHCAGHHFWALADPRHADHDSARAAFLGEPYRTILMDLDSAVGDLAAAVGPDAVIAVFSTSDMVPNGTLAHFMKEIVKHMNLCLGDTLPAHAFRHLMWRCNLTSPIKPPCDILPYNENCTALRVCPQWGWFRHTPGHERRKALMLERIESMLRELVDADTGQPLITAIDRPSAKYMGKRAAALPDLLVRYTSGTFPRAVVSPRLGRFEAKRPRVRPGNHAAGGFLIIAGDACDGVNGMQDLGPMAAKVLHVTIK
jgi:predicted AlkP superfamily phosphohydrolase/phosphomutase